MKTSKIILMMAVLALFFSCGKDGDTPPEDGGGGTGTKNPTNIIFENSTFSGSVLVTYTDGSTTTGSFDKGKFQLPVSSNGNKTIASLQPENQSIILIGRKEGSDIKLNYNNGVLAHRIAIAGFVPIGTYAEFQLINKDEKTLSASYKLETDLDLMNVEWTPIGIGNAGFKGNFDGDNHEILNLSVVAKYYAGLFGYAEGNINNVVLKSGNIKQTSTTNGFAGGIVAYVTKYVIINNCTNFASVEGYLSVGGIVGEGHAINNCKNYGLLKGIYVGGIAATGDIIENCHNYGDIINKQTESVGGVAYIAQLIKNCSNSGNINISNTELIVSIGGIGVYAAEYLNCYNIGDINISGNGVRGQISIGGITPIMNGAKCKSCYNGGNIYVNYLGGATVGGIVGDYNIFNENCDFESCYNTGNINNQSPSSAGTFENATGGLIGWADGFNEEFSNPIKTSYSTGTITGKGNFNGGIIGVIRQTSGNIKNAVSACYWKDIDGDDAQNGIGSVTSNGYIISEGSNTGCSIFSAAAWPSASYGWLVGNNETAPWKTLGSWNGGNPIYPKLWFEN
jgi:hypothetical protein